jgi:hypothetical protein
MKKILFAFLLLSTSVAFASEADSVKTEKKTQKVVQPKKQPTAEQIAKKNTVESKFQKFSKDRFTLDLFGSNWAYNPKGPRFNDFKSKPWGRGLSIYFSWDFRIKKSRVSFAPGIGYSCSNIYSRSGLVEDSVGTHFEKLTTINPATPESDVKDNKICLQYVDIPLELRIRTNPDKFNNCWKFVVGFKAGIRVDAHTKEKTKIGSVTKVDIERRFPDFNLLRMGPTIRIGYSVVNVFAYYGILSVFKKDRGPAANEFTVGISFNGL